MIEEIDRRLTKWVKDVVEGVSVQLSVPDEHGTERAVWLNLLDLRNAPPAQTSRRLALQLSLRYLITTSAKDVTEAHRMLGQLVFAAMEHSDFDVELEPVPLELWQAYQIKPQPSFMLCVPLRLERREQEMRRVTRPVEIRHLPIAPLKGQVIGPGEIPVCNAVVELPDLQISTRTDTKGWFEFDAVPSERRTRNLRIKARGKQSDSEVALTSGDQGPLVIRVDGLEV